MSQKGAQTYVPTLGNIVQARVQRVRKHNEPGGAFVTAQKLTGTADHSKLAGDLVGRVDLG